MRFAAKAFGLVCCVFALVSVTGGCRSTPGASGPPNVLLISIDTLRADRLNTYGYKARVTSPSMDALAKDSILFEHHITASPWTTPSHMSLFTGLLPSAHGITRPYKVSRCRARGKRGLPDARCGASNARGTPVAAAGIVR